MTRILKIMVWTAAAMLLVSGTAYADSSTKANPKSETKSGKVLLKNSYDYLGALGKYAFTVNVINTVTNDGESVITKRVAKVKVHRPDKFRIDSKNEAINRTLYLSDGTFVMMDNQEKYYAKVDAPKDIDKTLEEINRRLGIRVPLSTFLHSDMGKYIHPKKVFYFGTVDISGVACDYIAFKQGNTDVHLWIEDSNTPVVRSAKIITKKNGTTDMVLKWDTAPGFSDDVFVFNAPEDASNISVRPVE